MDSWHVNMYAQRMYSFRSRSLSQQNIAKVYFTLVITESILLNSSIKQKLIFAIFCGNKLSLSIKAKNGTKNSTLHIMV